MPDLPLAGLAVRFLLDQSANRAQLHAFTALYAGRFTHGFGIIEHNFDVVTTVTEFKNFVDNAVLTAGHTSSA